MGCRTWTEKQIAWLRDNAAGRSRTEITERFNRHFRTDLSVVSVNGAMLRYKIRSGVNSGWLQPGHNRSPSKKGHYWAGCENGWFKKGGLPHNTWPVGKVWKDDHHGYLRIKVGNPDKWAYLHHLIWEYLNGPVPEGHIVIFGDRNSMNLSPSNLVCVSRAQLAIMNAKKLIYSDAELTKVGAALASVKIAVRQRKLNLKKKERKKNGTKRV